MSVPVASMPGMRTRFHGWPEQASTVLLELDGEPSRATRERVRRDREQHVRQPMIDLLNDLADADPWYEDFSVWRYASTAYWWQNQCAVVRVARHVDIAFRFSLDGLQVTAAWWYAGRSRSRCSGRRRQRRGVGACWRILCERWTWTGTRSAAT